MSEIQELKRAKRPCPRCPFRKDAPPGEFPAGRYACLAKTAGEPGAEAAFDAPMFGCHQSKDARPYACAGWLAVVGREHLGVRLAVALRQLDPVALDPALDWPELFGSWRDMVEAQAGPDVPALSCRLVGVHAWHYWPDPATPAAFCPGVEAGAR